MVRIYKSPYEALPSPEPSSLFHSHLEPGRLPFPDSHPAFIDALSGRVMTRGELRKRSLRLGKGLQLAFEQLERYGVVVTHPNTQAGRNPDAHTHVVLIFSPNSIEFPVAFYGSQAAGYITSLANSGYTARELAHQLRDSTAKIAFVAPSHVEIFLGAKKELGREGDTVQGFVLLEDGQELDEGHKKAGLRSFKDLWVGEADLNGFEGVRKENGGQHDVAVLCYSSGTVSLG